MQYINHLCCCCCCTRCLPFFARGRALKKGLSAAREIKERCRPRWSGGCREFSSTLLDDARFPPTSQLISPRLATIRWRRQHMQNSNQASCEFKQPRGNLSPVDRFVRTCNLANNCPIYPREIARKILLC